MPKPILSNIIALVGISLLCAASALAEQAPSSGEVYNTREASHLLYFCEKSPNDSLDCDFTQTRVRKSVKPEVLKARLDMARKQFSTEKVFSPDECKQVKDFAEVFRGRKMVQGKEAETKDWLKSMSDLERKDVRKQLDASIAGCDSKSEENYLNVVRTAFDKDVRTCIVSSNTYKQSFRLVLDPISGAQSWVATGDPSGPCGVVQLSRFEPEQPEGLSITFWKYIAKKAVTNKQGMLMERMACTDLDEAEYIFDWRSKDWALGCDYIIFSPL